MVVQSMTYHLRAGDVVLHGGEGEGGVVGCPPSATLQTVNKTQRLLSHQRGEHLKQLGWKGRILCQLLIGNKFTG